MSGDDDDDESRYSAMLELTADQIKKLDPFRY